MCIWSNKEQADVLMDKGQARPGAYMGTAALVNQGNRQMCLWTSNGQGQVSI
jgi:hypothetical protein